MSLISHPGLGLRCWVGHLSQHITAIQLVNCSLAASASMPGLDLTFGNIPGLAASFGASSPSVEGPGVWACSKVPWLGTVTKDCVAVEDLPDWWGRLCNGAVCYCNDRDGCNSSPGSLPGYLTLVVVAFRVSFNGGPPLAVIMGCRQT